MFNNFRGRQNRFGYYPPFAEKYVFLQTLLGEESPKARALGQSAITSLSESFEAGGLFQKSFYDTGLLILKTTIDNERSKELAMLSEMKRELGDSITVEIPSLDNAISIDKFYQDLNIAIETMWDKGGKIRELLTKFPGSEYGKAERVTQRLYKFLQQELFRVYNKSTHAALAQDDLMEEITLSMLEKNYHKVKIAIVRAVTRMLYSSNDINNIQQNFVDKILKNDIESEHMLNSLINIVQDPTGLSKAESKLTPKFEEQERKRLAAAQKKRKYKSKTGRIILPMKEFYKNMEAKGPGYEGLEFIAGSLMGHLGSTKAIGSILRKTDTMITIGTISIDLGNIIEEVYKSNPILNRKEEKGVNAYQFAVEIQKAYERAQEKIQDAKDSFVIHISNKDYMADTITKKQGFSSGEGMTLSVFKDFAGSLGMTDISFLIFALNNLSKEAFGGHNTEVLSNFLAQFIGMFTFDDGITIYANQIQEKIPNVRAIHMYALSGQRVPLSYLLQKIYDSLVIDYKNIVNSNTTLQGYVKVKINSPTNFQGKLDSLTKSDIFGPKRWEAVNQWSLEKTKIKMNFFKNFDDMVKAVKV